jgi:hypothetical protein
VALTLKTDTMGWWNKRDNKSPEPYIPAEGKTVKINPKNEKPSLEGTDFELEGKKYRFKIAKFRVPNVNDGQPITAAEAKATPEALKYLVENGSQVIEEIV